jgi:hypothetical protein
MVFGVAQHLGDDPALFSDAQPLLMAKGFDVDLAVHAGGWLASKMEKSDIA